MPPKSPQVASTVSRLSKDYSRKGIVQNVRTYFIPCQFFGVLDSGIEGSGSKDHPRKDDL